MRIIFRRARCRDLKLAALQPRAPRAVATTVGTMVAWEAMSTTDFNVMAFAIKRAHVNSQPDLHIAASVPRCDARGNIMRHYDERQICGCVVCEVYDLKYKDQRTRVNQGRTAEGTVKSHKRVLAPATYVTGNPFGTPSNDMLGLLRIIKGTDFEFETPAVMPNAAQTALAHDAGTHRNTAMRKDLNQNLRDTASLAGLQAGLNQIPNLQNDQEGRELLGIGGERGARGAARQAQHGSGFSEAHHAANMRQPGRDGTCPANP